jgi:hypothetical protein
MSGRRMNPKSMIRYEQTSKTVKIPIKAQGIVLLCVIVAPVGFLSAGCTTSGPGRASGSLRMNSIEKNTRLGLKDEEESYQPPRSPQFNTARDQ